MAQAAALIGIGGSVIGAINASDEQRLKNEATNFNTAMSLQQATLALQESAEDERRLRVQGKQQLGEMRANYGASGITMEGSPLEIMQQSAANLELDALTIRHQGEVKAWAYRNQAKLDAFDQYASQEMLPGRIAASIFGAGGQAAQSYSYSMRRT